MGQADLYDSELISSFGRESERWSGSADAYASLAPQVSFYLTTNAMLISNALITPEMTVMDLGCGSACLTSREILRQVPGIRHIYAVDVCSEMIQLAARFFAYEKVTLLNCAAEHVDKVVTEQIDRVICNSAFWLFDAGSVCAAIRRILSPRGLLICNFGDWELKSSDFFDHPRYQVIDEELAARGMPPKAGRGAPHKHSVMEFRATFQDLGFRSIQHYEFSVQTSARDWQLFFEIPAMVKRSLPHLPFDLAADVLKSAMNRLGGRELPPMPWVTLVLSPNY